MKVSDLMIQKIVPIILGGTTNMPTYRKLKDLVVLFQQYGRQEIYDYNTKEPINPRTGQTYSRIDYTTMALRELNNTLQLYDFLIEQLNITVYHDDLKSLLEANRYQIEYVADQWIISNVDYTNTKTAVAISFRENLDKILSVLNVARVSIDIAMAWFTNDAFLPILKEKQENGVRIRIILNHDGVNQLHGCDLSSFCVKKRRGNSKSGFMHDKLCVIDNQIVITGSYNWSENAEYRNIENIAIIEDNNIASTTSVEFQRLWDEVAENNNPNTNN